MAIFIKRGFTFDVSYTLYENDRVTPIDLTGITITYCLERESGVTEFATTVTPLTGQVSVTLSAAQTSALSVSTALSYLKLVVSGTITTRGEYKVSIV